MGRRELSPDRLVLPWPAPERYKAMMALPRLGWCWELVRRNPHYRGCYRDLAGAARPVPEPWPFLIFENPDLDAAAANVFWRRADCAAVLPLMALAEGFESDAGHFLLTHLTCRIHVHKDPVRDVTHVLFAQNGRALQLEIAWASRLPDAVLATPALPPPGLRRARLQAVRRLVDLMRKGSLRPLHYPREHSAARLAYVMQAFDGEQAGRSHRDIAIALVGRARVEREWHGSQNLLRDHVRKTIRRGRFLTESGYRRFLT